MGLLSINNLVLMETKLLSLSLCISVPTSGPASFPPLHHSLRLPLVVRGEQCVRHTYTVYALYIYSTYYIQYSTVQCIHSQKLLGAVAHAQIGYLKQVSFLTPSLRSVGLGSLDV